MAKAGGDAVALAEALASHDDIDAGLAAYHKLRQPIGERIMLHGRKLGTQLGVNLANEDERNMCALLQDPRAMMDWIAVPNFLSDDVIPGRPEGPGPEPMNTDRAKIG
jgi:2-polyprenyl-6-methoxyphenol hydroxylase-like FAD-dependent oxidoreductase